MNKKYFLFGSVACRLFDDASGNLNDNVLKQMKNWGFSVAEFDNPCDPVEVLNEYDGWEGYAEISKTDYELLSANL